MLKLDQLNYQNRFIYFYYTQPKSICHENIFEKQRRLPRQEKAIFII